MRQIVIWTAYPETSRNIRDGSSHLEGRGDDLLWWIPEIFTHLSRFGFTITWGDLAEPADLGGGSVLLLLDRPSALDPVCRRLFKIFPPARRVLLRLEPPVIAPQAYSGTYLKEFGGLLRVEPSPYDTSVVHVNDFDVPAPPTSQHVGCPESARDGIISISSNKKIIGPRGSLYRARARIYRQLASSNCGFALYGQAWDHWQSGIDLLDLLFRMVNIRIPTKAAQNLNYKGMVNTKSLIADAKYTVITENFIGLSYMSEKVFDSLKYGVVPIYWGGRQLGDIGLDHLVIQVNTEADIVQQINALPPVRLRDAIKHEYERWRGSPKGMRFSTLTSARVLEAMYCRLVRAPSLSH